MDGFRNKDGEKDRGGEKEVGRIRRGRMENEKAEQKGSRRDGKRYK